MRKAKVRVRKKKVEKPPPSSVPWKLAVAVVVLGLAAIAGDVLMTVKQQVSEFVYAHWLALAGGLLVVASLTFLLIRAVADEEESALSVGDDIVEDPSGQRALMWVEELIDFYDGYGRTHANLYFLLKVPTLIAAAALPALIVSEWSMPLAAWVGVSSPQPRAFSRWASITRTGFKELLRETNSIASASCSWRGLMLMLPPRTSRSPKRSVGLLSSLTE